MEQNYNLLKREKDDLQANYLTLKYEKDDLETKVHELADFCNNLAQLFHQQQQQVVTEKITNQENENSSSHHKFTLSLDKISDSQNEERPLSFRKNISLKGSKTKTEKESEEFPFSSSNKKKTKIQ